MEDLYKLCDKIVEKRVLTLEALKTVLTGISRGGKANYRTELDTFRTRAQAMNYRAKKNGTKGKVSPAQLKRIYQESGKCRICGAKDNLTFDHITPLYRGGDNTISNIQVLCAKCNMEKGVK